MNTPNDGGPAFPRLISVENPMSPRQMNITQGSPLKATTIEGMSLRDWFAGQALAGWLASFATDAEHPVHKRGSDLAIESYKTADAMLAARQKGAQ